MQLNDLLTQVYQPYFYYSVLFLVISFVCICLINRSCHFISPKVKSLLYLVPLAIPLIVMAVYLPQMVIQTTPTQVATGYPSHPIMMSGAGTFTVIGGPPLRISGGVLVSTLPVTVFSVTGLICTIGLIMADVLAIIAFSADDRLARRFLHVIALSNDDYQPLQKTVAELSKKMALATPKIGVVEDLRPNAFTVGYGKRATIVFSIGLLNILDDEETAAVASHELAHIKNRDFFYKLLSSSLTALSFFNPLTYIASSAAQREREMLADQEAVKAIGKPNLLSSALAKICKTLSTMPKQSRIASISSNLLVTSSVLHRFGILSTHPRLDRRLRNISVSNPESHLNPRKLRSSVLVSLLVISIACMVVYGMANLQTSFSMQVQPAVKNVVGAGNGAFVGTAPHSDYHGFGTGPGPFMVTNPSSEGGRPVAVPSAGFSTSNLGTGYIGGSGDDVPVFSSAGSFSLP